MTVSSEEQRGGDGRCRCEGPEKSPRPHTKSVAQFHTLTLNTYVPFTVCFTSTETIRLIRDGERGTATSTFTQLLSFECMV